MAAALALYKSSIIRREIWVKRVAQITQFVNGGDVPHCIEIKARWRCDGRIPPRPIPVMKDICRNTDIVRYIAIGKVSLTSTLFEGGVAARLQ